MSATTITIQDAPMRPVLAYSQKAALAASEKSGCQVYHKPLPRGEEDTLTLSCERCGESKTTSLSEYTGEESHNFVECFSQAIRDIRQLERELESAEDRINNLS